MGVNNRLQVNLAGWELENPIMNASGTYGMGYELAAWIDSNKMGAVTLKATSLEPRKGNANPRIAETASGMLNAIGLQNPGIEAVLGEELPKLAEVYHKKVVANIVGNSVSDYVEVARRFDAADQVAIHELNISCPNTEKGGMEFGVDPESAAEVVRAVKAAVKKPVFAKLSPNVTDIVAIAKAVEEAGADGLTLINTIKGMRIDLKQRAPLLGNVTGGLSGPAIFPVALRMVYDVYRATRLPIIGVGGIVSAEDVLEMMMAGATAVQIGAAGFPDPSVWVNTVAALPETMDRLRIEKLTDIIGAAHGSARRKEDGGER